MKCLEHLEKSLNIQKHEEKSLKRLEVDKSYGEAWTADELLKVFKETMNKKPSDEGVHVLSLKSRHLRGIMDKQQKKVLKESHDREI